MLIASVSSLSGESLRCEESIVSNSVAQLLPPLVSRYGAAALQHLLLLGPLHNHPRPSHLTAACSLICMLSTPAVGVGVCAVCVAKAHLSSVNHPPPPIIFFFHFFLKKVCPSCCLPASTSLVDGHAFNCRGPSTIAVRWQLLPYGRCCTGEGGVFFTHHPSIDEAV